MQTDKASLVRVLCKEILHDLEHPEPTIATGMPRLDDLLDGGIRPGEVFVLAARPRVGKSALALQFILNIARQGKGVALWSLEMRPKAWIRRAACALSGVGPKKARRGEKYMTTDELRAYVTAAGELEQLPLFFVTGKMGFQAEAELHAKHGCSLLVIDYLQLMEPPQGFNREHEVSQLSRTIKLTANELSMPTILLAQLNRNAEGKVPVLADLRESGAVEQDADEVFFLHRELNQDTHVLSNHGLGILAKNRDGEAGSFHVHYDWKRFKFVEMVA